MYNVFLIIINVGVLFYLKLHNFKSFYILMFLYFFLFHLNDFVFLVVLFYLIALLRCKNLFYIEIVFLGISVI